MGITVSYQRISLEKFAEIQDSPESAEEFFFASDSERIALLSRLVQAQFENDDELIQQLAQAHQAMNLDTTKISIEKEWQAIHYLLTGEVAFDRSQAELPLSSLVLGGTPTKFEAGYGYVRYLSPDEVKKLAQALHQVSRADLRSRFDARGSMEIYAQEDEWDEKAWEFLLSVLDSLISFLNEASVNNEVILISSS